MANDEDCKLDLIPSKAEKKRRRLSGGSEIVAQKGSKRTAGEIRKDMAESQHAILVRLERADGRRHQISTAWDKIAKYGLTFTQSGCMIPAKQFWPGAAKNTRVAYRVAALVFMDVEEADLHKDLGSNHLGWPCKMQISHLCHVGMCCNPGHLVIEEQWRNLKRNYCGLEGKCDCGGNPPCLQPYRPSNAPLHVDSCLTYHTPELLAKLKAILPAEKVKVVRVLQQNAFKCEDEKSANRKKRRKAKRHHEAQRRANEKVGKVEETENSSDVFVEKREKKRQKSIGSYLKEMSASVVEK